MWNGKVTDELRDLFQQYCDMFGEGDPDEYDDLCYDDMTYDEFVGYIKKALKSHRTIVEVVSKKLF